MSTNLSLAQPCGSGSEQVSRKADWDASLFVWGVWAVLFAAALFFVAHYKEDGPVWDEWFMVPIMTGDQPVTAAWLFETYNDYRLPLPKLVFLGLARLTNTDYRAPGILTVLILGLLAGALIVGAKRARGNTSYTDALLAVALLHWGHFENMLHGMQIVWSLPIGVLGVLLLLIVWHPARIGFLPALVAGGCFAILPLCGAVGLMFVPTLLLWFAVALFQSNRQQATSKEKIRALALFIVSCVPLIAYFIGFQKGHTPYVGLGATLRTSARCLSSAIGPAAQEYWPYSFLLIGAIGAVGVVLVGLRWRRCPDERLTVLGLSLFLAGLVLLALSIGRGRAFLGIESGFQNRYGTGVMPVLLCLYFIGCSRSSLGLGRLLQMSLFVVVVATAGFNFTQGFNYARGRHQTMKQMWAEARSGASSQLLAEHYYKWLLLDRKILADNLELLRRSHLGPFRPHGGEGRNDSRPGFAGHGGLSPSPR